MKKTGWFRRAPGVYDSADGRFALRRICYWELVDHGVSLEGDGMGPNVGQGVTEWDTKAEAQKAVEGVTYV